MQYYKIKSLVIKSLEFDKNSMFGNAQYKVKRLLTFDKLDSELKLSNLKSKKFNDKLSYDNIAENY